MWVRKLSFAVVVGAAAMTPPEAAAVPPDASIGPSPRAVEAGETSSLADAAAQFRRALRASDAAALAEMWPPRVLLAMARDAGLTPADLIDVVRDQAERRAGRVVVETVELDDAALSGVAASGDGLVWGVLPLRFVAREDGRAYAVEAEVLAMREDGVWRLFRPGTLASPEILTESYPELVGVAFRPERVREIANESGEPAD